MQNITRHAAARCGDPCPFPNINEQVQHNESADSFTSNANTSDTFSYDVLRKQGETGIRYTSGVITDHRHLTGARLTEHFHMIKDVCTI